jgi:histidyl-tRNA synthetase
VIVGENEFESGNVLLKDLESGEQQELKHDAQVILEALSDG